jgi:hypothetical protein
LKFSGLLKFFITKKNERKVLILFKNSIKEDDLIYDVGNMMAIDTHPIDISEYNKNKIEYIKNYSTENVQLLLNKIYDLPIDEDSLGKYIELPNRISILPREKPVI